MSRAMPLLPLCACTASYGHSFAFKFVPAVYHIILKIHVHIQDGVVLHFMNSNTITHKLTCGHQPCSTGTLKTVLLAGKEKKGGEAIMKSSSVVYRHYLKQTVPSHNATNYIYCIQLLIYKASSFVILLPLDLLCPQSAH